MIGSASLVAAGIGATQARQFEAPLRAVCERFRIDTPERQAAFVAQCAHESTRFTCLEEGLYYRSAERICAIFRSCVPDAASAQCLAGNPKALANRVYAGRNGNGDEASGDGWRYRGRGLIQLTGRANYARATAGLDRNYVGEPDRVLDPFDACLTAGWFWDAAGLNALADAGRIDDITRAINGRAMAGARERRELYQRALAAFGPPVALRAPMHVGAAPLAARTTQPATTERATTERATTRPARKRARTTKPAMTKRATTASRSARAALVEGSSAGLPSGAMQVVAPPRRTPAKATPAKAKGAKAKAAKRAVQVPKKTPEQTLQRRPRAR